MYDRELVRDILQQVGVVYSACADHIGVLEQTIDDNDAG